MILKDVIMGEMTNIKTEYGMLKYQKVTLVSGVEEGPVVNDDTFFSIYADIVKTDGDFSLYTISSIAVKPEYRGQGKGSELIKKFINEVNPNVVLIACQPLNFNVCSTIKRYCDTAIHKPENMTDDELHKIAIEKFNEELSMFFVKNGFTNINKYGMYSRRSVPMIYPESEANRLEKFLSIGEEFCNAQYDEETLRTRKTLESLAKNMMDYVSNNSCVPDSFYGM